jgi:hypothetical protein
MGMSAEDAHISRFDAAQCERLVLLLNAQRPAKIVKPRTTERTDFSLPDCCHHVLPWEHCEHTRVAA